MWLATDRTGRTVPAVLLLVLAACTDPIPCLPDLVLADENDYTFSASLDIASTPIQAPGDPILDWSDATTDLLGHALDPATDILTVAVVVFEQLTEEEVEQALATDTLSQADVTLYVSAEPAGATQVVLSDLTLLGNDIDVETYWQEGAGTWLALLSDTTDVGVGARMVRFMQPSTTATETTLHIPADSAALTLTVDMDALTPLPVPAGEAALTLDWSGLTTNGRGAAWEEDLVDEVLLARYDDLAPADLAARFADVEILADDLWNLAFVGGTSVDLAPLATADPPFPGIDDTSTWALALRCSTCANPAPPFFTVLEACEP